MSGEELLRDLFGAQSEDDKVETFQRSTLSLVLKDLGAPASRILRWQKELREAYNFDWFNDQHWTEHYIVATRVFRFNLLALFKKPRSHPIVVEWERIKSEVPLIMVFKCFELGRLIATNLPDIDAYPGIHVPSSGSGAFRVIHFPKFFTSYYGTLIESENP